MDPIEEVEMILTRLAPSAMSERAARANDSMIDGLASGQITVSKDATKRRYWWPTGIAASLIAGVGLVFLDQPQANAGAVSEYEILETIESTKRTPDAVWVEKSKVIKARKNDLVMQVGRRDLAKTSGSLEF
ncbi:MAG: hypothetical protein ACK49I_09315 [Verrucomicrobiota bacterium]